jgi:hypothetical protein
MGLISDLPDSLNTEIPYAFIYRANSFKDDTTFNNAGFWQPLRPGFGSGYYAPNDSTNYFSDKFGLELQFAREILARNPGKKIALFKFARGGASIDTLAASTWGSFDPRYSKQNQWDYFLASWTKASTKTDIDGDGKPEILVPKAILWMQGESDASFSPEIASRYEKNLSNLMQEFRKTFRNPTLPVLIGQISSASQWQYGTAREHAETVRKAQENFVQKDKNAYLITGADSYVLTDGWHYRAEDYLDMGKRFAASIANIKTKSH